MKWNFCCECGEPKAINLLIKRDDKFLCIMCIDDYDKKQQKEKDEFDICEESESFFDME